MSQCIKQFSLCILIMLSLFSASANAEGVRLKSADLERADSDWLLNATFQIELTPRPSVGFAWLKELPLAPESPLTTHWLRLAFEVF